MTRVVIANRRDGGWWWRLPLVALIWLAIVTPIVAASVVVLTLRSWARDLPGPATAWREGVPEADRRYASCRFEIASASWSPSIPR